MEHLPLQSRPGIVPDVLNVFYRGVRGLWSGFQLGERPWRLFMRHPAGCVRQLAALAGVRTEENAAFAWTEIERGIGLRLPADYKLLAESLPSGWVRGFARLSKPERPQMGPQRLDDFDMQQLETLR